MKKVISFMVVLTVLAMTSIGYAGERAGAFSISPFVGGYMYDENDQRELVKNRVLYGLRLGYDVTDHFGIELVGHYVTGMLKRSPEPNKHIDIWSYRLDLLYNFMPHSMVVPYLAIGGGGQSIRYGAGIGNSNDGTANAGGGFKFFMTEDLAFRADARHILDFEGNCTQKSR
jgi:OOP family OmpA-OmpF porin